jgi:hypothetical protein
VPDVADTVVVDTVDTEVADVADDVVIVVEEHTPQRSGHAVRTLSPNVLSLQYSIPKSCIIEPHTSLSRRPLQDGVVVVTVAFVDVVSTQTWHIVTHEARRREPTKAWEHKSTSSSRQVAGSYLALQTSGTSMMSFVPAVVRVSWVKSVALIWPSNPTNLDCILAANVATGVMVTVAPSA